MPHLRGNEPILGLNIKQQWAIGPSIQELMRSWEYGSLVVLQQEAPPNWHRLIFHIII
jgi:hypothetical protein